MSAFNERRDQDVRKLRTLQDASAGRIKVIRVSGTPPSDIDLELRVKTAPSREYPRRVQDIVALSVSLPARYPFIEPLVTVKTPIFHPNVYSSGRICLGLNWLPSLGLDLLIRRVVQIATFDPSILNEESPANRDALSWYREAKVSQPGIFPTDTFSFKEPPPAGKGMQWRDVSTAPRVQVTCTSCFARLALPGGKTGRVRCPKCGNTFEATT